MNRIAGVLVVFGLIGGSVDARGVDLLARFSGGIGVNPVAGVVGPANADGSFPSVKVNIVRNVMPAGGPWRIEDLQAEIDASGRVNIKGTGLLLANGDKIGQNANLTVFATLICEAVQPFTERSTSLAGVPLDVNGDFRIDDVLDSVPGACASPVLLIRTINGSRPWFAAGIPNLR